MTSHSRLLACTCLLAAVALTRAAAQQAVGAGDALAMPLAAAIGQLGSLEYSTRMNAARVVRRADARQAGAALIDAVANASDQFVRYRALVLLTGFSDRRTAEVMDTAAGDRNDRLREVAYRWMAVHPRPDTTPRLLAALQTEQAEFVRPALVRALAALGGDRQVQRALVAEVPRGQDFFRISVIDALGEFKAGYAREAIADVARIEGPLQDDAVLALGRIGDPQAAAVLASLTDPPPDVRPAVQAAYCLLGSDCGARIKAVADLLNTSTSRPEVVRSAVTALTVLGASASDEALSTLTELARASRAREAATVGLGGAALRSPGRLLAWLRSQPAEAQPAIVELLRAAFEEFEEDFAEEQFFAATRAAYWSAPDNSAERSLMATLIQRLEF